MCPEGSLSCAKVPLVPGTQVTAGRAFCEDIPVGRDTHLRQEQESVWCEVNMVMKIENKLPFHQEEGRGV